MKLLRIIILVFVATLAACNHDVFIDRMTVTPTDATLPWTGGEVEFKTTKPNLNVTFLVMRAVNGDVKPMTADGFSYHVSPGYDAVIRNELCDIKASVVGSSVLISSGYNLFPDTLYIECEIIGSTEGVTEWEYVTARIMPSPGYNHMPIEYELSTWWGRERCDTIDLGGLVNMSAVPVTWTLREKDAVLAESTGHFEPWDSLMSDNIFGRTAFKVEGISCLPPYYFPELSDDSVVYNRCVHPVPGHDLKVDSALTMTIPAYHSGKAFLVIHRDENGIEYTLPATPPLPDAPKRTVDGLYWISTPADYEVVTTIQSATL